MNPREEERRVNKYGSGYSNNLKTNPSTKKKINKIKNMYESPNLYLMKEFSSS